MFGMRMKHYVSRDGDGSFHVQNAVMGQFGQHHVHTQKEFDEWVRKNRIAKEDIVELGGKCDCGLKAGEVVDGLPTSVKVGT